MRQLIMISGTSFILYHSLLLSTPGCRAFFYWLLILEKVQSANCTCI